MTTLTEPLVIDTPGVYDIPEDQYHLDPVPGGSLSSSGSRRLLPPSCPALFKHWRGANQRTPAMDFGVAAHRRVLGVGADIVVVDADDWRGKAAQQQRDEAHEAGGIPLLLRDYAKLREMETALRQHSDASALLDPGSGEVERSLFWPDQEFGVWRRARLDMMRPATDRSPFMVVDYKTTTAVDAASMCKSMTSYSYDSQGAWYIDAVEALRLAPEGQVVFVLVFQLSDPPYLVRVAQPDPETIQWGRIKNRKAISTYRECSRSGVWPGYPPGVVSLTHPRWAQYQLEAAWASGDLDVPTDTEVNV